jgi:hypothetical protein
VLLGWQSMGMFYTFCRQGSRAELENQWKMKVKLELKMMIFEKVMGMFGK